MFFRHVKKFFSDPGYCCIVIVAAMVCLYMAFNAYINQIYDYGFVIPCMLWLGIQQERGKLSKNRNNFILPCIVVVWFLLLQLKRDLRDEHLENIGLFITVYLFAFPLASVLREQNGNRALKIFAGACVTAAAFLATDGLMLLLDCLPDFMTRDVNWDGARLVVYWHPNVAGCFLMIGIIFCTAFLMQAKSVWVKIGLSGLIALMIGMMALTSSRTATILTGGFFGSVFFYMLLRRGRKWFIPAVVAALIVTVAFYSAERFLFDASNDRLIRKYTQEYSEQIDANLSAASTGETELPLPVTVDPESGEVHLVTESSQGNIVKDFGTFNSRTHIWSAAKRAIRENPLILFWGAHNPGELVSTYTFSPFAHLHNAWMQCLVGMGVVGFLMAVVFTLMTAWNALIVLVRHYQDVWKRSAAILALCLLAASVLEPYLFYIYFHLTDFIFFLCAGYLAYWQEEDNRRIMRWIRSRLSFLKK